MKGKWEQADTKDYYIIIRGTAFAEFADWIENNPVDDNGMLAAMGYIVEQINNGQSSGVYYVQVFRSDLGFANGNFIAVAWRNKTCSSIEFATGNFSEETLADIKGRYDNVSAFPGKSFFLYAKR